MKLNVDGSYSSDSSVGDGMILRDHEGTVIFAACRQLLNYAGAVDAELAAMEEGLSLSLQWSTLNVNAKTDCAEARELIKLDLPNTSIYVSRVQAIHELIMERNVLVARVDRDANSAKSQTGKECYNSTKNHCVVAWLSARNRRCNCI